MKARGYTELSTTELPDELQFSVVFHNGWINLIADQIIYLFPIFILWQARMQHNSKLLVLLLLIFALSLIDVRRLLIKWLHGNRENLIINRNGISISGNLGYLFLTQLSISASELTRTGFGLKGGRQYGVPKNLEYNDFYLQYGRKCLPILRGLNQDQKKNIYDLIIKRFPAAFGGKDGHASILFGDQTGIETLGLSESDRDIKS
jgi:hypothetical protein